MIKIALFTEGQTEQIFVRSLLFQVIDNSKLSLDCIKLHGGGEISVPFPYICPDPKVHFLIIDVGNDNRVLSAIGEREERLFEAGYEKVIGLRDMYSEAYDKRSPGNIDDRLTENFIENAQIIIDDMSKPESIVLIFAIMEIEAWFLAMYNLFSKIDETLSVEFIEKQIRINLKKIDPQKDFYKPSSELKKILRLIGKEYRKSKDDSEMLCSKMELSDFATAVENNRSKAFKVFYEEMEKYCF